MTDPQQLGSYKLVHEVGYGGMGSVFLAERAGPGGFHKRVAIKTIHPHLAKERAFVDMFLDEARIAAAMNHPNVAQVFDLGEVDGTYFLAMEYLHGEHLGAVQQKVGRFDDATVARIGSLVARGLHHAHEVRDETGRPMGLVHRDVSPQNIFLTYDGQVKVTDFGIARAEGRLAQTTNTGRIKGKCAYMSPEQVTAQPVDRRADIFAVGIILWELLAGERLFAATNDAETILRIVQGEIPPLEEKCDCDPALATLVMKALATATDARFATAEDMARALDAFLAEQTKNAHADSDLGRLMAEHFDGERSEKERSEREHSNGGQSGAGRSATNRSSSSISAYANTDVALPGETPSRPSHPSAASQSVGDPSVNTPTTGRSLLPRVALVLTFLGIVSAGIWWFTQGTGTVRIDSQPSGAVVRIDDGEPVGTTPVVVSDLHRGRHRLSLELPGFNPLGASFDVDRNQLELGYQLTAQVLPNTLSNEPSAPDAPSDGDGTPGSTEEPGPVETGNDGSEGGADDEEPVPDDSSNGDSPIRANPTGTRGDSTRMRGDSTRMHSDSTGMHGVPTETDDVAGSSMERRPRPTPTANMNAPSAMEETMESPMMAQSGSARLTLMTRPWATVRINGRDFGQTPVTQRRVPAGLLNIELRARGSGPIVRRQLQANEGAQVREFVRLPE